MKLLSRLLILIGVSCYIAGGYYFWLRNDPNRLAFTNYHSANAVVSNTKVLPVRITIHSVHIDLPISPAAITHGTWPTTNDGASYLVSSPVPGEKGNSIIYAHDFASLFGNLPSVHKGDVIEIQLANKSIKKFVIQNTSVVSPDNTKVLSSSTDARVTLYTCTGWFDSKRFVAVAFLEK
jgi:LPXTG-site transpeptidase (sortase) family protein